MKTLVFWSGNDPSLAARRAEHGACVLAWRQDLPSLTTAGILSAALVPPERDAVDEAAIAWTKAWGRRPLLDGKSFRELLAWDGVALWSFAELFLHHSTAAPRYVRVIETFHRLLDRHRPDEVDCVGLERDEALLLGRTCLSRGILFHGPGGAARSGLREWRTSMASRWNGVKTLLTALKSGASRKGPAPSPREPTALFLSHAAFWRGGEDRDALGHASDHYFDRLIPELEMDGTLAPRIVAVGPRTAFRRRGTGARVADWVRLDPSTPRYVHMNAFTNGAVLRASFQATRLIRRTWRTLRQSPALAEAFSYRGVSFADLALPDLAGTLLLQLPWAVRSYEEMKAALRSLRPAVVCLYAESSGWGRAAVAACRAAGVPTVAIQHGILYPKYYSYRYEADDADALRPTRTAVFGESARRALTSWGHYPPESLEVTGSPKFDRLVERARAIDREALRQRLGVAADEKLVVVASRYRAIRDTHSSIGRAFPGLVRAVEATDAVRAIVKPHPAEPAQSYADDLRRAGARRVTLAAPGADLLELLHAADLLVTVESLSALEALVLGRPLLVLEMPTNLADLVAAGVAVGVDVGVDAAPALRGVLFDADVRRHLATARARYVADLAFGLDGLATRRILDLVRRTALGPSVVA